VIREPVTLDLAAGIRPADAPALFAHAAAFHSRLADELAAWPQRFAGVERRAFAVERRRLLHTLLDRALDAVELVGAVERGSWP